MRGYCENTGLGRVLDVGLDRQQAFLARLDQQVRPLQDIDIIIAL
jgi:hypothetical protein